MVLTSCAVSPEHLAARRLFALNAHASNQSLTLCMLGNVSCFLGVCWHFSKFTFLVGADLGPNCLHRLSADNMLVMEELNVRAQLSIGARV